MTNYDTARISAFCSNDENFEFVSYNDPRAAALRAQDAKAYARRQVAASKIAAKTSAKAGSLAIGQRVKHSRMPVFGTVDAVNGAIITITFESAIDRTNELTKKIHISAVVAA